MRFALFIAFLIVFTLILLYVVGDRRHPTQTLVVQDIELEAK